MAAFRESTLDPAASPETVERFRRDYKLGPPLYFLAAAAAPFSAWLSLGICTALWVFWLCQRANVEKRVHSIIHYAAVFIHNE